MIIVDVETSGLVPERNGILSIGAINFKDPTQYFYGEGKPHPSVEISQGALDVNGYTREQLDEMPKTIKEVMLEFIKWVDEQDPSVPRILAGHNIGFDYYFILNELDRNDIDRRNFPFKHRTIDLHTIAQTHYIQKKGFQYPKDMGADFIQKKLGLPVEPSPHYALNGALYEAECISRLWFDRCMFQEFEQYPIKDNPWN